MAQTDLVRHLLGMSRRDKRMLAVAVDVVLCAWSVWAAFYLRLEEWVWLSGAQWLPLIVAPLLAIPIFAKTGIYRAVFRFSGWPATLAVVRASLIYGGIYATIFTFVSVPGVPRTVGLIQPVLLFMSVAASRAAAHYLLGASYREALAKETSPNVLIYGAGASGRQLAAAVMQSRSMSVIGFLDDDRTLQGALLNGIMVHHPDRIMDLVKRYDVGDVLLAVPSASRRRRKEILDLLRPAGANVRTLPGLLDLAQGRFHVSELRPVEIEDLLGRDAVAPDQRLLQRDITGKVVLVTGGGGSIGGELCRQILDLEPSMLLVVDSSEYALYAVHRELEGRKDPASAAAIMPLLASVLDESRMRAILSRMRPDTIYHAAAYKHVPLVEHNVLDGIRNNAFGTLVLARAAIACGVGKFVLISTDKAVRPTNVMGASKRLAELALQALAAENEDVRFTMVRFGNVLGSSGSVVPLFRQQIGNGGPVTITHPDATRYFMTIPEAAQLVIQAGAMAIGGEVFVLDMGEPVKVYDLAVNMVELSGLTVQSSDHPGGDIEITVVGLRPGEKLHEELVLGDELTPTQHERIMQARERFVPMTELESSLRTLDRALALADVETALAILQRVVPEYAPASDVVDWLAGAAAQAPADPASAQESASVRPLRLVAQGPHDATDATLSRTSAPRS